MSRRVEIVLAFLAGAAVLGIPVGCIIAWWFR